MRIKEVDKYDELNEIPYVRLESWLLNNQNKSLKGGVRGIETGLRVLFPNTINPDFSMWKSRHKETFRRL